MQLQNRIIKIKNASKRMSNYKSCIFILTRLFGFEKSDNGEKLTLSDEVEIDTLIILKTLLQDNNSQNKLNDELSSYEMKMTEDNESFWSCNHCTYNNPIELNTCKMCALPRNVCVNQWGISHSHQKLHLCFVCIIFVKKSRIILCKWSMIMMKKETFNSAAKYVK